MFYTLTVNPSIDYYMNFQDAPAPGDINRSTSESIRPGGKGFNVSIVLSRLGIPNTALGFVAGQTGNMLCQMLSDLNCTCDLIWLTGGLTRINVKINGTPETALNGAGPSIDEASVHILLGKLSHLCEKDTFILSGNLPQSMEPFYPVLLECLTARHVRLVVDSSGAALKKSFHARPFLIKPNASELGELFGIASPTLPEVLSMAREVHTEGPKNILVSLGKDGALLLAASGIAYHAQIHAAASVRSTVGAGDSMTAGYLAADALHFPAAEALCFAVAAGSATAYSDWLASSDEINALLPQISITEL